MVPLGLLGTYFSVPETMVKSTKTEYFRANPPNLKTFNNFIGQNPPNFVSAKYSRYTVVREEKKVGYKI